MDQNATGPAGPGAAPADVGALPISDTGASAAGSARLGLWLTALLAIPVAAFFVCAAFSPATLAVPLSAGKPATIWFLYGLALIAFSISVGGVYVLAANRAAARTIAIVAALALACTPAHAAGAEPTGPNVTAVSLFL